MVSNKEFKETAGLDSLPEQTGGKPSGKSEVTDPADGAEWSWLLIDSPRTRTIFKRRSLVPEGKPGIQKMMALSMMSELNLLL
jgi:hypothetical protein